MADLSVDLINDEVIDTLDEIYIENKPSKSTTILMTIWGIAFMCVYSLAMYLGQVTFSIEHILLGLGGIFGIFFTKKYQRQIERNGNGTVK